MRRALLTATALTCLSGSIAAAQTGPMPVVSGLKTVPAQHGLKAASAPAPTRTVRASTSAAHDCVILYMGAGGDFFASALRHQAENARARFPKAVVEMRYHFDARPVPASCRNPLLIGHSMGALRVNQLGNAAKRGRVIMIDAPNWAGVRRATVPTINFFHCPPSPFGCGRIVGGVNVNLSAERRRHVRLPYSPRITQEVKR